VRRWWAGHAGPAGRILSVLAAPAEGLFRAAVARRNRRYDRDGGERVAGLWVVSVGNLAVGGTGKTPVSAWVARLLAEQGLETALLARGYGEDELLLHRRWNPGVAVVADPDRRAAARLARRGGAGAAVLDDGFQHRALARDVDVVLLATEDGVPGRLLPCGPFREPISALGRADAVVVTRRTAGPEEARQLAERVARTHPRLPAGVAALLPGGWEDLGGGSGARPTGPVLAVAAVARPEAFAEQVLRVVGASTELMAFPDHHPFGEADARAIRARAGDRTVVVTEKDAVKLQRFAALLEPVRVMVQALVWEAGEEALAEMVTSVAPREV
jgi:tetraacyldisaccharide 4'-kinase